MVLHIITLVSVAICGYTFFYNTQSTPTKSVNKDDIDAGASPFGVQLKGRSGTTKLTTPTPKKTTEPSPEFKKLVLRKTDSSEKPKKTDSGSSKQQQQGFGVSLKVIIITA